MSEPIEVNGSWRNEFDPVIAAFAANFAEHDELGASFAAFKDGEKVVDVWAGYQDVERTVPWAEDTIVNVFSTTKTMTFLVSLLLFDRGEIDPLDEVGRFWPEFKANGKDRVRFVDLLTHAAGLAGFTERVAATDLYDWDAITAQLAAQAPWWEPGTATGYHAVTQGFLIGEVVRRITGQSIGAFFHDEVARPLHVDFHIGTPVAVHPRVADIHLSPTSMSVEAMEAAIAALDPEGVPARSARGMEMVFHVVNTPEWRQAEIPAANGHGNARSVARAQHVLANHGEAFGVRLLSQKTALAAVELQIEGVDLATQFHLRFGLGYGLPSETIPTSPNPRSGWWAGAGGSIVVVDLDERLSYAYVMNQMAAGGANGDPRANRLSAAVYESLSRS